ncbi:MAG: DM13 domain-containing protein [Marinicaulis sp.]|nr:DM13 domain-containing protein [Marinicaulis sp.]
MNNTIRVTLVAVSTALLAGCGGQDAAEQATAPAEVADHLNAASGVVLASGEFEGRSDHIMTGDITITRADDGVYVVLGENFSLDGAPDPKLGFGNGEYLPETKFSPLNELTGQQVYKLPQGVDLAEYTQVWVWCEKFNVPLGVASLTHSDA